MPSEHFPVISRVSCLLSSDVDEVVDRLKRTVLSPDRNQGIALDALIAKLLGTLDKESFNSLISAVKKALKDTSFEKILIEELLNTIEAECESQFSSEKEAGGLFVMPVAVSHTCAGWALTLDAAKQDALRAAIIEHKLLASDSTLTFFPRLVSNEEIVALNYVGVFELCHLMGAGNLTAASDLIAAGLADSPVTTPMLKDPDARGNVTSMCAVIIHVKSNSVPIDFPLADSMLSKLVSLSMADMEDDESAVQIGRVYDETCAALTVFDAQLTEALAVHSASILAPTIGWYQGATSLAAHEREYLAQVRVNRIVTDNKLRGPLDLTATITCAEKATTLGTPGFVATLKSSESGVIVGNRLWHTVYGESNEDANVALLNFLASNGIGAV